MVRKKSRKNRIKKEIEAEDESIETRACPECGSTNVIYSKISDNTICQDCGAIFAKLIPEEEKKFEKAREQK